MQHEICSFADANLWQYDRLISELAVGCDQSMVLNDRVLQPMPPFAVRDEDFWPRRGHEHLPMVTPALLQSGNGGVAGRMLKRYGRVNETPIEESPTGCGVWSSAIAARHLNGSPGKGRKVYPGERAAVTAYFFFDDPATRLRHGWETSVSQFRQQCRFSAA